MSNHSSMPHKKASKPARALFIKLRVSSEEKIRFEALASNSGLSLSDFIRKRLAGVRIYPAHIAIERNRQLAKIGNNVNQIARWANMHKSAMETLQILHALQMLQQEVQVFAVSKEVHHVD